MSDGRSVANLRMGILHHHDFPREEERVVTIDEGHRQGNLEKFAHLKERWDDLPRYQVLFVRWGWKMHEPLLAGIPPDPPCPDLAALIAALDGKFPQLDYRILLIDAPEVNHDHPKVLYRDSGAFTEPGEYLDAADLLRKDNTAIFSRVFSSVLRDR